MEHTVYAVYSVDRSVEAFISSDAAAVREFRGKEPNIQVRGFFGTTRQVAAAQWLEEKVCYNKLATPAGPQ